MNVLSLFNKITTFAFDIDGVLTDGTLFLLADGEAVRRMNIKDGYALQLAIKKGYKIVVISGSYSEPVKERLYRLGIKDVYMEVADKKQALIEYAKANQLQFQQILFMGDDMPDMPAMEIEGLLTCCPEDAVNDIKQKSLYVSPIKGGQGCVRDVIEKVMKLHQKWHHDIEVASK